MFVYERTTFVLIKQIKQMPRLVRSWVYNKTWRQVPHSKLDQFSKRNVIIIIKLKSQEDFMVRASDPQATTLL